MSAKNKHKDSTKKKSFDVTQLDAVLDDDDVALIIPKSNDDDLNEYTSDDESDDSYDDSEEAFEPNEVPETTNAKRPTVSQNKVQRTSERHVITGKKVDDIDVKDKPTPKALGTEYVHEKKPGRMVFKGVNFMTAEERAKRMNTVTETYMKEEQARQVRKKNRIKNIGLYSLYVVLAIIVIVLVYKIVFKILNRKRVDMDGILKNKIDELPEDISEDEDEEDSDTGDGVGDGGTEADSVRDTGSGDKAEDVKHQGSLTGGSKDKTSNDKGSNNISSGEILDTRLAKPTMISVSEMDDMQKSFEACKKPSAAKPKPKTNNKNKTKLKTKPVLKRDARGRFIARKK